jgi:methylenetetrahydrofolate dehydrogenase (NADP+)/methenyltetrahydrofolate cyclohydrolase
LKAKKAEELGIQFEKFQFSIFPAERDPALQDNFHSISQLINELNKDKSVDGIMIQLPFGGERENEIVRMIGPKKDVDGLREDSPFVPATVRAVLEILSITSHPPLNLRGGVGGGDIKVVVVGASGEVGMGLMKHLVFSNYHLVGMGKSDFDVEKIKTADVVISCTGQAGLIKSEMVKPGVIAIDVGYPGGDFDPEVAGKAAFFTPVPGGVGPVTVVMLFANLVGI